MHYNPFYLKYIFIFIRINDDYTSDECDQSSSSSSESDSQSKSKKKDLKISVTFLESLSNYVPIEDKHSDTKQYILIFLLIIIFLFLNRYFTRSGFKNKTKRQELAEKLFSMFDEEVFSSKVNLIFPLNCISFIILAFG